MQKCSSLAEGLGVGPLEEDAQQNGGQWCERKEDGQRAGRRCGVCHGRLRCANRTVGYELVTVPRASARQQYKKQKMRTERLCRTVHSLFLWEPLRWRAVEYRCG